MAIKPRPPPTDPIDQRLAGFRVEKVEMQKELEANELEQDLEGMRRIRDPRRTPAALILDDDQMGLGGSAASKSP